MKVLKVMRYLLVAWLSFGVQSCVTEYPAATAWHSSLVGGFCQYSADESKATGNEVYVGVWASVEKEDVLRIERSGGWSLWQYDESLGWLLEGHGEYRVEGDLMTLRDKHDFRTEAFEVDEHGLHFKIDNDERYYLHFIRVRCRQEPPMVVSQRHLDCMNGCISKVCTSAYSPQVRCV